MYRVFDVRGELVGAAMTTTGWRLFSDSLGISWPVNVPARLALIPAGTVLVAVAAGAVVTALPRFRQSASLR